MRHHGSSECPTVLPPFLGDDDGNLMLIVCQGDGRHLAAAKQEEIDGPADVAAAHTYRWSEMQQESWAAAFHKRQSAVKQRMQSFAWVTSSRVSNVAAAQPYARVVGTQDCIQDPCRHSTAKLASCNFAPNRWMTAAMQLSSQRQAPDVPQLSGTVM